MKIASKANFNFSKNPVFIAALFPAILLTACQEQEPEEKTTDLRIERMEPEIAAELARATEALVKPELSEGLSIKVWGNDSLVADPIGIDIDDEGRLFYTRTIRQKHSEFDIRGHQDWETESIRLQTVEDKRKFLRKVLSPENSAQNEWLADLNGDGSHDWKDMTVEKEQIFRLEDTSGDGVADLSQLVVEDFNDEVTDVAGAVMPVGEDLFVGVAPDMWRMKDTDGDGIADEKTSVSHGYGVHIGFGGHGMSGLEMGPDGRIYWGIGDIGFNGEGPDGTKYKYPNRGVIVRSNPDGSDFEVFAMGVRNTHEFVFDEYGNLLSVDNDGDHPGENERLVYIVNGSDTGWRINWQFGKYRDLDNNNYKVWMDEKLFKPRFEGQAAYITPPIANYISGPSGMLYNPGTALGPKWKNTFFVGEFVGNPAKSGIHAFRLKPEGASFALGESEMVVKGILPVGMDFGPDGAMYIADWIDGWDTKDYGRIWKLDDTDAAGSAARKETATLLAADFSGKKEQELGSFLANPDMRVRQKAQFELAKRGEEGAKIFENAIGQTENQLARIHGIWGISQLARKEKKYAKILLPLLQDKDPEIRAQAARWLGDVRYKEAGETLISVLKDENSRARFFAAEALGRIAYGAAVQPLISLLEANNDQDLYIRHAASFALAQIGNADALAALSNHPSAAVRMGAVLALRRLSHPTLEYFLKDKNEYIVTEAARAINDDYSVEGALPALGNVLRDTKFTNEPLIRRAINANLRAGSQEAAQNLTDYALREDAPAEMRAEALAALSTWAKPSVLDRVDGRYRGVIERDAAPVAEKASGALIKLSSNRQKAVRLSAVKAIGRLQVKEASQTLQTLLKQDKDPEVRVASLKALAQMENNQMDKAIQQALSDSEKSVRVAGLDLMAQLNIEKELMVELLSEVVAKRTTEEKQAAISTLGSLPAENTKQVFEQLLDQLENKKLPAEIQLELAEAIAESKSPDLIQKYKKISSQISPDSMSVSAYRSSLLGGDPERGRALFFQHSSAQCMRCHSYDDMGGNAGPRLNGVAGWLTREQILEALIDPSARLAPGYGVTRVDLKNGKSVSGILQGENEKQITLKVGNNADTVINKQQIVKRVNAASSMPDMKHFLTRREIRDLVSFLATLKEDHN